MILLASIAGGALVIALVLYFVTPRSKLKVPAVVLSACGGLGLGFVVGVGTLAAYGDQWDPLHTRNATSPAPGAPGAGGGMAKAAGAPGKGGGGAPKKKGGGRGPTAKSQLVSLVTKLDLLTKKPLSVSLSDEQKTKLRAELDELNTSNELSEDEAKERLDAIHGIVQNQRFTLESAGYAWPTAPNPGGGFPMTPPNPFTFKGSADANHFESLLSTVGPASETPSK